MRRDSSSGSAGASEPAAADQRADQAVAREDRGAAAVGSDLARSSACSSGRKTLTSPRGRVERADEGDDQQRPEVA